jgi:hypothetical protein
MAIPSKRRLRLNSFNPCNSFMALKIMEEKYMAIYVDPDKIEEMELR